MNRQKVVGKVGKFDICFRAEQLTSHAGTVLLHDFAQRVGIAELRDEELHVKTRARGDEESQAVGGLIDTLILGGAHLSELAGLRGDAGTQEVLNTERILAPTTAGEFLRKSDMGEVHDLQRVPRHLQGRMRPYQQAKTCTIDLASRIYEPAATHKEGSPKADKGEVGYPPVLAFWAEEGELLYRPLRRGRAPTARNVVWFLRQPLKRGPGTGDKKLRSDRGVYSYGV